LSLIVRAVHVYYRKIKEHIWTTEWYRNGLERLGNGKLEQCGEGEKTRVFWELWGWRHGQGRPSWKPSLGAVLSACFTFSSDFLPLGLACSSAVGLDLIIPSLFGAGKLCNDHYKV